MMESNAQKKQDARANRAIVKEVAGRRFFFGRERPKRSRKYHQKLLSPQPINLSVKHKLTVENQD